LHRSIQEAQLPQKSRASISVVETLKCSFGVTQGHWKRHHSLDHIRVYEYVIVSIALFCTVVELFNVENSVTLKSGLEVTQGHLKWYHSKASYTVSYSHSIATMTVSLAVSTQYTNVADTQPQQTDRQIHCGHSRKPSSAFLKFTQWSRQKEIRYAASL